MQEGLCYVGFKCLRKNLSLPAAGRKQSVGNR